MRYTKHITLQLNPQHTIPTIDDNGFSLWESRAIMTYFVNQYGKDDSLYPKDPKKRAVVDQRLYFDIGTLYARFGDLYVCDFWKWFFFVLNVIFQYPIIFAGAPQDPAKLEKINEAMKFLDIFLEGEKYVAGDNLTVADLTIVATVSTLEVVGYDLTPYKNVSRFV